MYIKVFTYGYIKPQVMPLTETTISSHLLKKYFQIFSMLKKYFPRKKITPQYTRAVVLEGTKK